MFLTTDAMYTIVEGEGIRETRPLPSPGDTHSHNLAHPCPYCRVT